MRFVIASFVATVGLLVLLPACDTGLPPGPPPDGGPMDLSVPPGPMDAASTDLARYMGDGPPTRCETVTCGPESACVLPACCPRCMFLDGDCPPGTARGACPIGGRSACVEKCTPPPAYCAPIPVNCMRARTCDCLDARTLCGAYGGACASNLDGDGYALYCMGCF